MTYFDIISLGRELLARIYGGVNKGGMGLDFHATIVNLSFFVTNFLFH
jgi:hypothetical protein